jgi:integrase
VGLDQRAVGAKRMTPQRTSAGGQFRTDWRRKEIGRIRVTFGHSIKEHLRAVHLLDDLYKNNQLDVLQALQARRVTIQELLAAKTAGRLKRDDILVDLRLRQPLWSTLEAMVDRRPGGAKHHVRLMTSLKKLAKSAEAQRIGGAKAIVGDLRRVDWRALRNDFGSAADWNHLRKAVSSTLSALLEDVYHPFRRDVMKRIDKEPEPQIEITMTSELFWRIVRCMPEHGRAGIVTLAITGFRLNTEYFRATAKDLRPEVFGIYAPGSKNADARGVVPVPPEMWPWVLQAIPAPLKERWLRIYFRRACEAAGRPELKLGHLRHCTAIFALEGGAPLNEVQALMRHANPAMTMRYAKTGNRQRAAAAIGRALKEKGA